MEVVLTYSVLNRFAIKRRRILNIMSKRTNQCKKIVSVLCILALLLSQLPINNEVFAASRTITVNPNVVINSDFAGVGVDIIPTALMENNLSKGYNEAYWEMDQKRLTMMKPKIARLWFQPDWMESAKGIYTWDSDKMIAFYKYLDALKAAGTEVELNFGWKVGRDIQSWFSIPGEEARISAPADLDDFAKSCSDTLDQLINAKGYNNVKYLTFYNEPNGDWDFDAPGDEKAYYANMVQKVHDKLTVDGRRSLVKIWGPEESGALDWVQYMKDNKDACFDGYTFHTYGATYNNLLSQIKSRIDYVAPKPVFLTEFGFAQETDSKWIAGYANSIIAGANAGLSGMAVWQYNGVWCEDPDENSNTDGNWAIQDELYSNPIPKLPYYQVSMMERYIPAHSSVISATTTATDVRTTAFKTNSGDDYTVLVECKAGEAKELTIDFSGVDIGKTFGKHIYTANVIKEANGLIPVQSGTFSAGTTFTDSTIPSDYCVIVYTTLPSQTQVEVTPALKNVDKGATLQLNAAVIDNTAGVTWSIASGVGTVSESGLYTAPADAVYGDMVSIKATSTADPNSYGIALITISTAVATPTPSPIPEQVYTTLMTDDFSGDLSKWQSTDNSSITGGGLSVANNETIETVTGGSNWTDYIFEADVKITSKTAGIIFRKTDDNNFYMWSLQATTTGDPGIHPMTKVAGNFGYIKTTPYDFVEGTTYHVKIEAIGSTINTYIDGELADTTTDTLFSSGKVGFRESGESAVYDNIVITGITAGVEPTPTPTPTPTPAPTYILRTLMSDDFSGDLGKWTSNNGEPSISNGEFTVAGDGHETIVDSLYDGSDWKDYILELDLKITKEAAGIIFRKTDASNYYMWQFNAKDYALRPHKLVGGNWGFIKAVGFDFELNHMYNVKIEVIGSTIKTYIDEELVDITTDLAFTNGKIGFREYGESAVYDNVVVKGIVTNKPGSTPPTKVEGVTVDSKTDTTVSLHWTASTNDGGEVGYDLYNGGIKVNTGDITSTNYTVTGLNSNTTYSFTIAAKDVVGNYSTESDAVSTTTSSTPIPTPTPTQTQSPAVTTVKGADGIVKVTLPEPKLDSTTGIAKATLDTKTMDSIIESSKEQGNVNIEIPKVKDATEYALEVPTTTFSSEGSEINKINIKTDLGTIEAPTNMFKPDDVAGATKVALSIGTADITSLSNEEVKGQIGDRPVIELKATADGRQISWHNPDAPVKITVDYTPTAVELKQTDHLVVWYIDETGKVTAVPNGKYDVTTGKITFTITHFSTYAVAYVQKTFSDISKYKWAQNQIEVIASKGIIDSVETTYKPETNATRGEFMAMLVKTLGLTAKTNNNFIDVKTGDKYYQEIAIAKELGLTVGVENNKFSPDKAISRQDMMVLVNKALEISGKLTVKGDVADLKKFNDEAKISSYAKQSIFNLVNAGIVIGEGKDVNPRGYANKASVAVLIYNLIKL